MSIVEERYSKWLNHENLAPQYKPVLEAMNAEAKKAAQTFRSVYMKK